MMNAWKARKAVLIALGLCVGVVLVALASTNRFVPPTTVSSTVEIADSAVAADIEPSSTSEAASAASTTSLDLLLAPIAGGDSRADSYRLEHDSCCVGN